MLKKEDTAEIDLADRDQLTFRLMPLIGELLCNDKVMCA